ncbi:enoyl-CoA hydratase/isomerase family protein [Ramlibacter tataouinensis]|uniref:Unsaturated acyl-CoA hydratase n=1 Tax=Ramlibacter tataouinensis (strain ATCC BAA-407 / DSM 14655 / LMG 21543 / TTB310) TaxID=365046 RepID=F5Y5M5_RAMTT|nr:enoyl-CoA hydratase/isomerase family protein [Ramlibacter tataouinensis]AEG92721.1 Unsaturated acyl-CoA hydratase [Ramlibacter tataouinensis TTB310]
MSEGQVHLTVEGAIASVTFDRPEARNAMTWAMYEALVRICERLQGDASVRVVRFRGAGGQAFVAGTDIAQFQAFTGGEDGVAYERRIDACMALLESLPMPTVAVLEGWAIGGGLAIATACDFRIATPGTRLGVPIARTLGNCLSMANVARLVAALGRPRAERLLLLADLLGAEEALAAGFLLQIAPAEAMDQASDALCERLAALAPVTQQVSKQALNRLLRAQLPEAEDLIRRCYGSQDFREGVQAFVAKRPPAWRGR